MYPTGISSSHSDPPTGIPTTWIEMYPESQAKPKVKEMVEGGETDVDAIFDKLKSEMLLVKKDTIAGWVEEFGGEPARKGRRRRWCLRGSKENRREEAR